MAESPDPQAGIDWLRSTREEDLASALSGRSPRTDATPDLEREMLLAAIAFGAGDDERFARAIEAVRLAGAPTARLSDLLLLGVAPLGPARAGRAADVVRQMSGASAGTGKWVLAALEKELPSSGGKTVEVAGKSLALLRSGDLFYAVQADCPHRRGPMADGIVENGTVTCPLHAWTFNLATGACEGVPGASLSVFEAKLDAGRIYVRL